MIIVGIDPGPEKCGFCVYDTESHKVIEAKKDLPVVEVLTGIDIYSSQADLVGIERVQSYGIRLNPTADIRSGRPVAVLRVAKAPYGALVSQRGLEGPRRDREGKQGLSVRGLSRCTAGQGSWRKGRRKSRDRSTGYPRKAGGW